MKHHGKTVAPEQFEDHSKCIHPPFRKLILLENSCFTMLCQFLLYSKVNQPCYAYIPFVLDFFPIQVHRALRSVSCALQQVIISYLFSTQQLYICQCHSPNSSHHSPDPWYPCVHSLCLCLYFCFANKFICRDMDTPRDYQTEV